MLTFHWNWQGGAQKPSLASWVGYIGVGGAVRCLFATATGGRGFYWPR